MDSGVSLDFGRISMHCKAFVTGTDSFVKYEPRKKT